MIKTLPGRSFHLGARLYKYGTRHGGQENDPLSRQAGVNFSVYSKNSTGMDLLLFDHPDDLQPSGLSKMKVIAGSMINGCLYFPSRR